MKKYFVMAMGFVAAVALTSCEPTKPTESAKITFKDKAIEISIDETYRLTSTITPAGAELQLKYASSDAAVATVSVSGIVTGVAEGEAMIIVSAEGATGDTCYVTVSNTAIYNSFDIAGWGLFGSEWEMIEGTDSVLTWEDGTTYDVQLGRITLIAWDGNLVYTQGVGWSGAGFAIEAPITFWIITNDHGDGTYNGYYIGHGGFEIYDLEGAIKHGVAQKGSVVVNDYATFLTSYIAAETSEDVDWDAMERAFPGAQIAYANYTDPENPRWSDSYGQFYGHIDACYYYDANKEKGTEAAWACKLQWHDFLSDDRYFGLKVNLTEEGYLESVVEPYDFVTVERVFYSDNWDEVVGSEARKSQLVSPASIEKEVPAFAKHILPTDRFHKK